MRDRAAQGLASQRRRRTVRVREDDLAVDERFGFDHRGRGPLDELERLIVRLADREPEREADRHLARRRPYRLPLERRLHRLRESQHLRDVADVLVEHDERVAADARNRVGCADGLREPAADRAQHAVGDERSVHVDELGEAVYLRTHERDARATLTRAHERGRDDLLDDGAINELAGIGHRRVWLPPCASGTVVNGRP